jgi:sugar phosphate isomerase/epimerase
MRFGIMTMQRGALIPSEMPMDQALTYIATLDHADLARRLHGHGFDPIELGGDMVLFFPQSFSPATIDHLAELKAETGVGYTVHLPLWSVEPSTPLGPVREGSVRALVDTVQAVLPLEPECYVLHATGALAAEFYRMELPELAKGLLMRQFQAYARESTRTLLEESGLPSRQMAIETIEFPLDLTLELADDLDLSLCLDTGHVLAGFSGPVGLLEALERCLPRLAEIHLHDAPSPELDGELCYGQDHRPLGSGDLDLDRLLDRLVEAEFEGPIIFELTVEEALASLEVVRATRPGVLSAPGS